MSSDKATTVDVHSKNDLDDFTARVVANSAALTKLHDDGLMPSLNLSDRIRSTKVWQDEHSRFTGDYGFPTCNLADLAIWRRSLGLWVGGSPDIHAIQDETGAIISSVVGDFLDTFGQANASEEVEKTRTKVREGLIDAACKLAFSFPYAVPVPELSATSSSSTLKRAGSPNSSSPRKHPRI